MQDDGPLRKQKARRWDRKKESPNNGTGHLGVNKNWCAKVKFPIMQLRGCGESFGFVPSIDLCYCTALGE